METSTIVTMIIVVGTVWGGLAVVLRTALKKEKLKKKEAK